MERRRKTPSERARPRLLPGPGRFSLENPARPALRGRVRGELCGNEARPLVRAHPFQARLGAALGGSARFLAGLCRSLRGHAPPRQAIRTDLHPRRRRAACRRRALRQSALLEVSFRRILASHPLEERSREWLFRKRQGQVAASVLESLLFSRVVLVRSGDAFSRQFTRTNNSGHFTCYFFPRTRSCWADGR